MSLFRILKQHRRLFALLAFLAGLFLAAGPHAWQSRGLGQEPSVSVYISGQDPTVVAENAKTVSITVKLTAPSELPVSVAVKTQQVTATANLDYAALGEAGQQSKVASFAPGVTSTVVTVDIKSDAFIEGNETFSVFLDSPQNATLGTPASIGVTILDQPPGETPYNIQLVSSKAAICAGGKNSPAHQTTITATLLDPMSGMPVQKSGVTVSFTTTAGTVSPGAAATDASGQATTTLTSNNTASSATEKYNATVTAQAQGNPKTVQVEFQAPLLALTASPIEIFVGDTSTLTLLATFGSYPAD